MLKRLSTLGLLVLLALSAFALKFTDYAVYNDIENGLKAAVLLEKSVLMVFTLPNCSTCGRLKNEALSNPTVEALLREHCVVIVAEAEKDRYAKFPFSTYVNPSSQSFETVNYYELITKKLGSNAVPFTIFLNPGLEMIGSTQSYNGYESYESALKTFIRLNARNPKKVYKKITASEKELIMNTLPYAQEIGWEEFKAAINNLDPLKVYILSKVKVEEVRAVLDPLTLLRADVLIQTK